jgi:hypothetical protein
MFFYSTNPAQIMSDTAPSSGRLIRIDDVPLTAPEISIGRCNTDHMGSQSPCDNRDSSSAPTRRLRHGPSQSAQRLMVNPIHNPGTYPFNVQVTFLVPAA